MHTLDERASNSASNDREADNIGRRCYTATRVADGTAGGKAGRKQAHYFPNGLLGLTGLPIDQQPGAMAILAGRLANDEDPAIAGHATAIAAAGDTLDSAVQAFEASLQSTQIVYGQVLEARAAWIRIYERTYGELRDARRQARGGRLFQGAEEVAQAQKPQPPADARPSPAGQVGGRSGRQRARAACGDADDQEACEPGER